MKIVTEKIVQYYVMEGDWIYGGPYETKEQAKQCLKEYHQAQRVARSGIVVRKQSALLRDL